MKQNYVNKEALEPVQIIACLTQTICLVERVTLMEEQLVFLREQLAEQWALDTPTNERLQKDVAEVDACLGRIHAVIAEAEQQLDNQAHKLLGCWE